MRHEVEEALARILIEHKIASLRKHKGLTQAALARRSGISQPMIAQIESGKLNNLTLKTLAGPARITPAHRKEQNRSIACGRLINSVFFQPLFFSISLPFSVKQLCRAGCVRMMMKRL